MPNVRTAVVFWRAPGYQRGPSPRQGFSIGGAAPTLRVLDGDKSPLVRRADAPKNVWPAVPLRAVVCGQAAIMALHIWNRRDADHRPVHRARVRVDYAPAGQDQRQAASCGP